MVPHTELIESLPEGRHRRPQDRGLFWARITILIVVSALLLSVVESSKSRRATGSPSGTSFPTPKSIR